MSAPVNIQDNETGRRARVTEYNQLVVAPVDYSTPITVTLDVINTSFNILKPFEQQSIVITEVIASALKSVSNTDPASIRIYTSNVDENSLTAIQNLFSPQLARGQNFIATGLNVIVPSGLWINSTTDDATVEITLGYYRVPVIRGS